MSGQISEHGFRLLHAILAIAFAEHVLRAGLVHVLAELEGTRRAFSKRPSRAAQRPTCQHASEAGHIRLGVAPVHTERVEFENLSRKVFIDADLASPRLRPALCSVSENRAG